MLRLKTFLDCGYTLLVEGFMQAGTHLVSAIDEADKLLGLKTREEGPQEPHVPTAADNDRALAQLQGMMAGL